MSNYGKIKFLNEYEILVQNAVDDTDGADGRMLSGGRADVRVDGK